jgi:hypothetical protein
LRLPIEAALASVVPLAAGLLAGRLAARLRGRRVRSRVALAALAVGPAALAFAPVWTPLPLGFWDRVAVLLLLGCGAGAGVSGALARLDRKLVGLAIGASVVGAVLLEAGARWIAPPFLYTPTSSEVRLLRDPATWRGCQDWRWCAIHGDACPGQLDALLGTDDGRPVVLHVGDSMVQGQGVQPDRTFVADLARIEPGARHVNAGFGGTGTDYQLLFVRGVLERRHVARVVVYLFPETDWYDLDWPWPWCRGGGLLEYGADGPVARCPGEGGPPTLADELAYSPPPFLLRLAAMASKAALGACGAFPTLSQGTGDPGDPETRWERLRAVVDAIRSETSARGVDLAFVVLPYRLALEADRPKEGPRYELHRRAAAVPEALGIRTLDAWDLWETLVRKDGAARYFATAMGPQDVHFGVEGHEVLARWLHERLGPLPGP